MWSPLVSIIIPSYNRESLIGETLTSIINQTYTHWECIVVDDGSTDKSMDVLSQYNEKDNRIKVLSRERQPKGASVCRNIGLAKASGDYVIYLDSDDVLAPFCLEQRVTLFQQNSDCQFLVFMALLFKNEVSDADRLWNIETEENDLVRFLRMDALWQTTGPIYKRVYLLQMNGFKEDLPFWQDFDLHLRCLFRGSTYKKCFDYPADYYIRTGNLATISRSTPFTAKADILQLRIKYYYSIGQLIRKSNNQDNVKIVDNYLSMVFYLSMQYFIRFRNPFRFIDNWHAALDLLPSNRFSKSMTLFYAVCLKLSNLIFFLKPFTIRYKKLFSFKIPDYYIMSNNAIEKIKLNENLERI